MARMGRPPSDGAKKTSINIRATEEQRQKLKDRANKMNLNLSEYVLYCCMREISEDIINSEMKK